MSLFLSVGLVERVDLKASVAGSRTPVGTPTYKGLAAQKGNTPSKRDDVEALVLSSCLFFKVGICDFYWRDGL